MDWDVSPGRGRSSKLHRWLDRVPPPTGRRRPLGELPHKCMLKKQKIEWAVAQFSARINSLVSTSNSW